MSKQLRTPVTRSGSSKSYGQSVTAQISENQVVIIPTTAEDETRSRTSSTATSTIPHFPSAEENSKPQKKSFFSRIFKKNKE